MATIEILDKSPTCLSFDLIDIVTVIEPFAIGLDWYFTQFEVGSFVGADQQNVQPWVLAFWHKIQNADSGIRVSLQELKEFARNVRQTDLVELVGLRPGSPAPVEPVDPNSEQFQIVVQAVDFDFWAVTTQNEELIARLKDRFKDTSVVASTRRYH